MSMNSHLRLRALSPGIGAEVIGFDLGAQDSAEMFEEIRSAVDDRLVLLFRRQTIEPAQLVAFARRFGPLMNLKRADNAQAIHVPACPEIKVISNGCDAGGRPLGDGGNSVAQMWHTDGSHRERPPAYTIFFAQKAPANPPRTTFMDMYRVYESLPEGLRSRIEPLQVIHHYYPRSNEEDIFWNGEPLPMQDRHVGPWHPLVRVNESDQRRALYLPQRRDAVIPGLGADESFQLLDTLFRHALASDVTCHVALEAHDLVVWDNRFSCHGREGWDPTDDRVMWHITVEGEAPASITAAEATRASLAAAI